MNNCLNSILIAKLFSSIKFEICISDNGSTDNISSIVNFYKKQKLIINYKRSRKNLGFGANFHKVVKMAKGEFIWIIGNDDLLYPHALKKLERLFSKNKDVDFYFVNSSSLNSKFVFSHKQPFNTKKIPKGLKSFSQIKKNQKTKFFDLIDPSVSWEFLLAIFLTVYRRKKFVKSFNMLDKKQLYDRGVWSTIDNTAPHVKMFSHAFKNSKSYIQAKPLSVNLFGEKEWNYIYPFIMIIRIPEILDIYRKNGLPFVQYVKCKNYVFKHFLPYMFYILKNKDQSNYRYINFKQNVMKNIFYPNIYFFGIYFALRKIYRKFIKIFK